MNIPSIHLREFGSASPLNALQRQENGDYKDQCALYIDSHQNTQMSIVLCAIGLRQAKVYTRGPATAKQRCATRSKPFQASIPDYPDPSILSTSLHVNPVLAPRRYGIMEPRMVHRPTSSIGEETLKGMHVTLSDGYRDERPRRLYSL